MQLPEIDFSRIRALGPQGQRGGFEQFVCELAAADRPADDARFVSLHGDGGDGGVECYWTLPDGSEFGWQAKYWTSHNAVEKGQLDKSVQTALSIHPALTNYRIAIPADPTGRTGRSGQSLVEKTETWRAEWEEMAAARGMAVEFAIEWRTNLVSRLQAVDFTGSRTRYWFDVDLLTETWWQLRLDEALAAARPRYVPELSVPVPMAIALAAMCGDLEWATDVEQRATEIERCVANVGRHVDDAEAGDFDAVHHHGEKVMRALRAWQARPVEANHRLFSAVLTTARESAATEHRRETDAMDAKHGQWDSVGWRQFQQEYQVSFSAAPVDSLRQLITCLDDLDTYIRSANALLCSARTALITGAAGTGKTFVACDVVANRLRNDRPSVLVHGRWFHDGDPLIQLRDRLQLPPDLTGGETLDLLNQAGRSRGHPVLLIVDALNDTVPRKMWRDHLDRIVPIIERHEHLRVVFTVRTHYHAQTIPANLELLTVDHRGFEGVEFEALAEYADYYQLEPPAAPPIHGEFDNPLALRLLCEALNAGGHLSLDHAGMGLSELTRMLLDAKNRTVSEQLGAPENDRLVHQGMSAVATALAGSPTPWLDRSVARSAIVEVWPDRTAEGSLLEALISEGLLAEDTVATSADAQTDAIVMAFERLGQHLVVDRCLEGLATAPDLRRGLESGALRTLVLRGGVVDQGLLEALSVAAADRYGVEITEFNDAIGDRTAVLGAAVAGLPWRTQASITQATQDIVFEALEEPETFPETMERLFRLAAKPDHLLNADWLHDLLVSVPMPDRDAFLVWWLHDTHGRAGAVDRLVRWAREKDLATVGPDTCRLWTTALLWCTGASDRRVRDTATLAAVRLLTRHPDLAGTVLRRFIEVDDDWIVERALEITYATLLRAGTADSWESAATVVWEHVFAMPPTNAAVRDAARNILESANSRNALPESADAARFRPPYASPWPIDWPTEADIAPYRDRKRYPKLARSCLSDDFFIYQLTPMLEDREGVDLDAAARRVLVDVIGLGYDPELHAGFDAEVLHKYGAGRSKPSWMERIGKKYQWIALARLLGIVADHTTKALDSWDPPLPTLPGPQSHLRQLDPTVYEPTNPTDDQRAWVPDPPGLAAESTDEDWVIHDSIPDVAVDEAYLSDRPHLVLAGTYDWLTHGSMDGAERRIWTHINTVLVRFGDLQQFLVELDNTKLFDSRYVRGPLMTTGFIGEYPFGIYYAEELYRIAHYEDQDREGPVHGWPGSIDLLGEYGYAPSDMDSISVKGPSPLIFGTAPGILRWDGRSHWINENDEIVARIRHAGGSNNELTIDREWFDAWLTEHDLGIVWLETAGQDVIHGHSDGFSGRLLRSRVRYRDIDGMTGLTPVTEVFPARTDDDSR